MSKRIFNALAILSIVAATAAAQQADYYDILQPIQPLQPVQPLTRYTPPTPSYQIRLPAVPTYNPPQRRVNPNDFMEQFDVLGPRYQRMLEQNRATDRAIERNRWQMCAQYNIHCRNMLNSLGR